MSTQLQGVVPVLPVPFHPNGAIDEASLRTTVEFVVSRGIGSVCIPAYGSEFYKLTDVERDQVIGVTIDQATGRVAVVAQANHPSARVAAELASRYEQMGAGVISFALPRQFATSDSDLMAYAGQIADAVTCPVLIQDFNPGGATVGEDFISTIHKRHTNVAYFKLEEPMIIDKLVRVRDTVGDGVGILGGWGGYYMLESIPLGLRGIMPGVPISDLLSVVFNTCKMGEAERAYDQFSAVLPYIAFTLQNIELFLQVEKRLMVRRGIFDSAHCRPLTRTLSSHVSSHADYLLEQVMRIIEREGLSARFRRNGTHE